MMVLVTYDVETLTSEGRRRLRKVAKQCVNHGLRVQNSVFECVLEPSQLAELRHRLIELIDPAKDSLRLYFMGNNWSRKVEHYGAKDGFNPEDDIIVI